MDSTLISTTDKIDSLFLLLFSISGVMLIGITVTMIYFVIRYHRSRNPEPTSDNNGNIWLELIWTIIPTIVVIGIFYAGWDGYVHLSTVPEGAMDVKVTGRMWSWKFDYENGKSSDRLYVPVGKPVKVEIISVDVVHSFFVPAFRVKRDAVPGMSTYVWFAAEEPGSYDIFCAEYCGLAHADMITTVEALSEEDFEAWLNAEKKPEGHKAVTLFEQYGCLGCHSLEGELSIGPSFKEAYDTERTVLINGKEEQVLFDPSYFARALNTPNHEVVKGYDAIMPTYADAIPADEIEQMIDYLKDPPTTIDGKALLADNGCLGCHSTDSSVIAGPSLKGLFESERRVERDGEVVTAPANRDYLKRAIVKPNAEITEGFSPMMPEFDYLSDEEIDAIIDAIEELR